MYFGTLHVWITWITPEIWITTGIWDHCYSTTSSRHNHSCSRTRNVVVYSHCWCPSWLALLFSRLLALSSESFHFSIRILSLRLRKALEEIRIYADPGLKLPPSSYMKSRSVFVTSFLNLSISRSWKASTSFFLCLPIFWNSLLGGVNCRMLGKFFVYREYSRARNYFLPCSSSSQIKARFTLSMTGDVCLKNTK